VEIVEDFRYHNRGPAANLEGEPPALVFGYAVDPIGLRSDNLVQSPQPEPGNQAQTRCLIRDTYRGLQRGCPPRV
jgi:hypothetical protein